MGIKLFLNVLYTIGIFLCLFTLYWGINHKRYEFVLGAVLVGALFIVLKIRLLKQVRTMQHPQNGKK